MTGKTPEELFEDWYSANEETASIQSAFLAGLASAREWQQIETAPKDGTLVLLGWFEYWSGEPPKFVTQVASAGNLLPGRAGFLHGQATHWQPLPPAPKG